MTQAGSQPLNVAPGETIFGVSDRRTMLTIAVLLEGALVGLAFLLGWWWDEPPLKYLHWSWPDLAISLAATAPLLLFVVLLERYPIGPLKQVREQCLEVWNEILGASGWWDILLYSALAGFCEELLFRGVLQPAIAYHLNKTFGIVFAALLFGLAHSVSVTYVVIVFVLGIYLGLLHEATDNLLVVMLVHGLYDFFAMAYLKARFARTQLKPPAPPTLLSDFQIPSEPKP